MSLTDIVVAGKPAKLERLTHELPQEVRSGGPGDRCKCVRSGFDGPSALRIVSSTTPALLTNSTLTPVCVCLLRLVPPCVQGLLTFTVKCPAVLTLQPPRAVAAHVVEWLGASMADKTTDPLWKLGLIETAAVGHCYFTPQEAALLLDSFDR